jgi:ABC-type transporter Mla MlaB component
MVFLILNTKKINIDIMLNKNCKSDQILQGLLSESPKLKMDSEVKIMQLFSNPICRNMEEEFVDNINKETLLKNKVNEVFQERGEYAINEMASLYFHGVQYFDFKNVYFINNTGIANLIDLLKSLLKQGVEVKFVNVSQKIKDKFKLMGLEHIFNCS